AVLTGIAVGLLGSSGSCPAATATPTTAAPVASGAATGSQLTPVQPAATTCASNRFAAMPAAVAVAGALVGGLAVLGLLFAAAPRPQTTPRRSARSPRWRCPATPTAGTCCARRWSPCTRPPTAANAPGRNDDQYRGGSGPYRRTGCRGAERRGAEGAQGHRRR